MSSRLRLSRSFRIRRGAAVATTALAVLGVTDAVVAGSASAATFAANDVVVYRVGTGSAALTNVATAVSLDEYSPSGTLVQSVAMPTTASGANKMLTASGSASSEGGLTLSADGRFLVATGYNATIGSTDPSSLASTAVSRTVASVSAAGVIDSSTSLTDEASANNVRSAVSTDGTKFWVAGADGSAGVRYAADGASTSTALVASTYKNGRQLNITNGQLYVAADPTKASVTVATVGTGTPTTGSTNAVTNIGFASGAAPTQPYGYSFLTLGTGTAPDTLYVADNSANAVVKYSLSGSTWSKTGTVALSGVTGVTTNDVNGTVKIYATTPGGLYAFSDASGKGGTLSGTSGSPIATAPTNTAFRGVAFAPGTVIGSGGFTPPPSPTITPAYSGLPATISDPTNPTLSIAVAPATGASYTASQMTLTATSGNTSVAPQSGITVSGTGATRTLTVTPGQVGYSTITLTLAAPDGGSATTTITYGVSAYLGDASDRYFDGGGNFSTAIDVGGGYVVDGDDNDDLLRLYNTSQSSEPVKTFDFTSQYPFGSTSIDIEAATRIGNTIYWTGSMTNSSSGKLAPSRSTLFATTVSGSGANTTLTYAGAYTGLKADFATWDHTNGHGLGADYFGLTASQAVNVGSHDVNAFDVEGMEAVQGSSTSAYLAFRAPNQPTSNRHLALVVPVTNLPALTSGTASQATFGAPMQWDLGGLGVREIRKNADGQYLIIGGTSDGSNTSFVLYQWDGNPAHPPIKAGVSTGGNSDGSLPLLPVGAYQGSWESIINVPDPLVSGTSVQLVEDNGNTAWYGDTATSKDTLPLPLNRDFARTFTYTAATLAPTTTAITSSTSDTGIGQQVTYTATVTPSVAGTPSGSVSFSDGSTAIASCANLALDANNSAACTVSYPHAATHNVTATYNGDTTYASSASTPVTVSVHPYMLTITADDKASTFGSPDPTFTYTVGGLMGNDQLTTQPTCGVTGDHSVAGTYPITCSGADAGSDYTITYKAGTLTVGRATPTVGVVADHNPAVTGQPVTFTATVTGVSGATAPSGTVAFTSNGLTLNGCDAVALSGGSATCALPNGFHPGTSQIVATYSGDGNYAGASSDGSLSEQVGAAASTTALAASSDTPTQFGQVTFTATVSVVSPGAGTPTGTVAFSDANGTLAGCDAIGVQSDGTASCTTTVTAAGPYSVSASYSGDSNIAASTASHTVTVKHGAPATLTVSPSTATIVSGAYQTFTTTGTDSQGRPLGDLTDATTFTIAPDGTCTANRCTAAAAGQHTVTATDGSSTATATLTVTAGSAVDSPVDLVGVGDKISQYGVEFLADSSPGVGGGYNASVRGRLQSLDTTGDADGRTEYSATGSAYDPSAIVDAGMRPVALPQNSTQGIAALLADTSGTSVQYVRSSRLPSAAEQAAAGANGWGGLHVIRYADATVRIAVSSAGTHAPSGLSPAELVNIYDGTWTTWGQVPGYSGSAPSASIVALLPAAGSDTRAAFDADLTAADAGTPVHYASRVTVVPADDYSQLSAQTSPADVIYPFSGSALTLMAAGYFAAAPLVALTGAAPDGVASYAGVHPLYVIMRDSDVAMMSPVPGSTRNWAHLLFVGTSAFVVRSTGRTQLAAAGLTPDYADLGDVSTG